jgi:hypothetical protein
MPDKSVSRDDVPAALEIVPVRTVGEALDALL